jgi:phosphatidylglycerophosphate synthase
MMPKWTTLTRSIILHGTLFLLAQVIFLVAATLAYGMRWSRSVIFLGILVVFHALLTALLLFRRNDFRIEATGQLLTRVNLSNTLTYTRLSSLPTILFLVLQATEFPASMKVILPFICAVFATDFLDGATARRRGEITFVGRYLDSTSDYMTIIAVTIVLKYHRLLPLWFLILVLVRLVFFAVGMALLALREGKADPRSTFVGKVSIFSLMVLYAIEVTRLFSVPWKGSTTFLMIVSYVVAAIVVASIVDKAIFLQRRFSVAAKRRGWPPAQGSLPQAKGSG